MSKISKGAGTTRRPLRVLLVEDCEPDAILLARCLERGGFEVFPERVDSREGMESALERGSWDVVLADHSMPGFSSSEALALVQARKLDIPFIIVSGHIEEEVAVQAMAAGAHDYIMKDRLARLVPAVKRELQEAEVRRARRKFEEDLRRAHEELETRVEKRTAELQAANVKLQRVLEERKRLETELLEIAENERRRIGFDLHDDLGQKLTGASLMIKGLAQRLAADGHPAADDALRIHGLVSEMIQHTHNLAHQFGSLDANGDSLAGTLRDLAANVKRMFSIPCAVEVKGVLPELPPNTAVQLYKIAQEAVSNAIKHGKASRVVILLHRSGDKLLMVVKNDGRPFVQPSQPSNRMGLRIMNYRANTISASLDIRPQGDQGTVVTCCCPLKAAIRVPRRGARREETGVPCAAGALEVTADLAKAN